MGWGCDEGGRALLGKVIVRKVATTWIEVDEWDLVGPQRGLCALRSVGQRGGAMGGARGRGRDAQACATRNAHMSTRGAWEPSVTNGPGLEYMRRRLAKPRAPRPATPATPRPASMSRFALLTSPHGEQHGRDMPPRPAPRTPALWVALYTQSALALALGWGLARPIKEYGRIRCRSFSFRNNIYSIKIRKKVARRTLFVSSWSLTETP